MNGYVHSLQWSKENAHGAKHLQDGSWYLVNEQSTYADSALTLIPNGLEPGGIATPELTSDINVSLQYFRLFLFVTSNSPESLNTPSSITSTVYIVDAWSRFFTACSIPHFLTGLAVQLPNRDWGYPTQILQSSQLLWPQEPMMLGILASITSSLSWSAKLSMYGQGLKRSFKLETVQSSA